MLYTLVMNKLLIALYIIINAVYLVIFLKLQTFFLGY